MNPRCADGRHRRRGGGDRPHLEDVHPSAYTAWDVTPVIDGFLTSCIPKIRSADFGILADSPGSWSSMLLVAVSMVVMSIIGVMLLRPRPTQMAGLRTVSVGLARSSAEPLAMLGPAVPGNGDRFPPVLLRVVRIPFIQRGDSAITVERAAADRFGANAPSVKGT